MELEMNNSLTMDSKQLIEEGKDYQSRAKTHFEDCSDEELVVIITNGSTPDVTKNVASKVFQKRHGEAKWRPEMLKTRKTIDEIYATN